MRIRKIKTRKQKIPIDGLIDVATYKIHIPSVEEIEETIKENIPSYINDEDKRVTIHESLHNEINNGVHHDAQSIAKGIYLRDKQTIHNLKNEIESKEQRLAIEEQCNRTEKEIISTLISLMSSSEKERLLRDYAGEIAYRIRTEKED